MACLTAETLAFFRALLRETTIIDTNIPIKATTINNSINVKLFIDLSFLNLKKFLIFILLECFIPFIGWY
jgi:hypothetical protein